MNVIKHTKKSFGKDDDRLCINLSEFSVDVVGTQFSRESILLFLRDNYIRGFEKKDEFEEYMNVSNYLYPLFNLSKLSHDDFLKLNKTDLLAYLEADINGFYKYEDILNYLSGVFIADEFYFLDYKNTPFDLLRYPFGPYSPYFLIIFLFGNEVYILEIFGD